MTVALIAILSFLFLDFSGDVERPQATIQLQENSEGLTATVVKNENVDTIRIEHESGSFETIDATGDSVTLDDGTGEYTVIAVMPDEDEEIIQTKSVTDGPGTGTLVVNSSDETTGENVDSFSAEANPQKSTDDGEITFELDPGEYEVSVSAVNFAPATRTVTIKEGETKEIDVLLPREFENPDEVINSDSTVDATDYNVAVVTDLSAGSGGETNSGVSPGGGGKIQSGEEVVADISNVTELTVDVGEKGEDGVLDESLAQGGDGFRSGGEGGIEDDLFTVLEACGGGGGSTAVYDSENSSNFIASAGGGSGAGVSGSCTGGEGGDGAGSVSGADSSADGGFDGSVGTGSLATDSLETEETNDFGDGDIRIELYE